jgi:hypothetical protein
MTLSRRISASFFLRRASQTWVGAGAVHFGTDCDMIKSAITHGAAIEWRRQI